MDVIGYLCISLDNSTVQLHVSQCSRRHAHVQKLVSVVKMAIVLEKCTTEEQRSAALLLWAKGLNAKIFIKKYFLFTVRSVCRVKRFTTGSINSLKDVRKSQMMPDLVHKWLRQQSKDFDTLVKRGSSVSMLVEDVSRNKWFFFSRVEYHMFCAVCPFRTYLLTLPRILCFKDPCWTWMVKRFSSAQAKNSVLDVIYFMYQMFKTSFEVFTYERE
jgi:hypothetical protein